MTDQTATQATDPDRCCVCGGGPVTYHNHRDLPFCRLCADCPCGQNPCVRTGILDPAVADPEAAGEPDRATVADALAAEYHRRYQRLENLADGPNAQVAVVEHVRGELIGLRGALGILLGGQVQDGTADLLGWSYYQEWRRRQEGQS